MEEQKYYFKISPENLISDLTFVGFTGETDIKNFFDPCCLTNSQQDNLSVGQTGYYLPIPFLLSGNTGGTSFLSGLTIPIMFTQTATDIGYYSVFDGAVLQKDVINNFLFTANTTNPYTYIFIIHQIKKWLNFLV